MVQQKLKAIIFDMDGTLANTEGVHRLAFNQAFDEFALAIDWSVAEYKRLLSISGGKERIYQYLRTHTSTSDINLREYALTVHKRKSEIYRQMINEGHLELRPGIKRLIKEAKANKVRMAIATSSSKANVITLINHTLGKDGLNLFDSVVSCDLIGDQKPSPAVYQYALAELGLAPDSCVAIEDTSNGNRSALAAGLKTIITTHEFTTDSDFTGASLVLEQLGEPGDKTCVDLKLLQGLLSKQTQETQANYWHPAVANAN